MVLIMNGCNYNDNKSCSRALGFYMTLITGSWLFHLQFQLESSWYTKMSLKSLFIIISILMKYCQTVDEAIDIQDILNADFLPSTLLLEDNEVDKTHPNPLSNLTADGRIKEAFRTMEYHRSMMNEYLCRNYVAEEILDELESSAVSRLGKLPGTSNKHRSRQTTALLADEGSSGYQEWLSRSNVMDDVYRHFDHVNNHHERDTFDELETGDITGFAVQSGAKIPSSSYGLNFHNEFDSFGIHPQIPVGDIHFSDEDHLTGFEHGFHDESDEEEHYEHEEDDDSHSKAMKLKDLFDLALTALAFLAFALFAVNLIIMCIMGPQNSVVMMESSTVTTTSTAEGREPPLAAAPEADRQRRHRRSMHAEELLNEIAYRVVISVDRLLELNKNDTTDHCLHYTLCQNNRYSRALNGNLRIWLPIWSYGMSWLSGLHGADRLGLLKASVLGLGDADCSSIYSSCTSRTP